MLGAHLRPRTSRVWSGGVVTLLGDFGFSNGAARIALSRLVNRHFLERERAGRLAFYTLTDHSRALLDEGDRRIFSFAQRAPTAEEWTVLWHSIPEQRRLARTRLARRLRFLGFGSLQDGTWLSPHDRVQEAVRVLDELGLTEHAGLLVGRPAEGVDFSAVATRVWDLHKLSAQYESYVAEFKPYTTKRARSQLDDRTAFYVRTRAVHVWRGFVEEDPELPDDLIQQPRFRERAVDVFNAVYEALEPAAERYFGAATTPG